MIDVHRKSTKIVKGSSIDKAYWGLQNASLNSIQSLINDETKNGENGFSA